MQSEADLLPLAAVLCAQAGYPAPLTLKALAGGRNNRVFKIETANDILVLKLYNKDVRDRQGAEWNFLNHCLQQNVDTVAKPLTQNKDVRATLMTFIEGRKLEQSEIDFHKVEQAANFIVASNVRENKENPEPAAEGCFSFKDHMQTIDRRVARLYEFDKAAPHYEEARDFVSEQLAPCWQKLRCEIPTTEDKFPKLIFSPSDFGFHNILSHQCKLFFIDFEYAGLDDPAKVVCDFFCCPDLHPSLQHRRPFINKLAQGLQLDDDFKARCDLLLDAYRIKWTCIILNDFMSADDLRRRFATAEGRATRCAKQLQKAHHMLAALGAK